MILFTLFLFIASSSGVPFFTEHQPQQTPHPHTVNQYDHHLQLSQQFLLMAKMSPFSGDYSHLDPKAPLSNKDTAILLIDHCDTNHKKERELTDAKFETTIKGLCDEIVKLRNETRQEAVTQARQIAEIGSSADACSDLDLKITTISKYLEQLISSLKLGLQDTLLQIDKDINALKEHHHAHVQPWSPGYDKQVQNVLPICQFHCNLCGYAFVTNKQLQEHIVCIHGVQPVFKCTVCYYTFQCKSDLDLHIIEHNPQPYQPQNSQLYLYNAISATSNQEQLTHSPKMNIHCFHCDKTFTCMRELNIHTASAHSDMLHAQTNAVDNDYSSHLSSQHLDQHQVNDEPIPQYDGPIDFLDGGPSNVVPYKSQSVSSIIAGFSLNKTKQLAGLSKHSSVQDFQVEINDSGRNVNIQCSTGFYEAVAKPAFSGLSQGFTHKTSNIFIECIETRNMLDNSNFISGILLRFSISGPGIVPLPASVSVHLHNTQQKVQLQGGAKMSDSTTSATWFLQHILKDRFIDNAKRRKFDISRINNLVASIPSLSQSSPTLPDECPHCLKRFTAKSRPV